MSNSPPGDEKMRLVQRDKSLPRPLHSAVPENEEQNRGVAIETRPERTGIRKLSFVASLILVTLAFSVGFSYLWEKRWSHLVASPEVPAKEAPVSVSASTTPAQFPLHVDMLHVTAIALGQSRFAIVNGQRVAEGESLTVKTSAGVATVRVEKIEDGFVRFAYGNDLIEANLDASEAQKPPP